MSELKKEPNRRKTDNLSETEKQLNYAICLCGADETIEQIEQLFEAWLIANDQHTPAIGNSTMYHLKMELQKTIRTAKTEFELF